MFADPQTVTLNAVAKILARVSSKDFSSIYMLPDEMLKLSVSHQTSNRKVRTMVRLDQRILVADPITSVSDYETLSEYTVIERPEIGFTVAQVQLHSAAHLGWLNDAAIAKLYGKES
jgi:hypothetical protein